MSQTKGMVHELVYVMSMREGETEGPNPALSSFRLRPQILPGLNTTNSSNFLE